MTRFTAEVQSATGIATVVDHEGDAVYPFGPPNDAASVDQAEFIAELSNGIPDFITGFAGASIEYASAVRDEDGWQLENIPAAHCRGVAIRAKQVRDSLDD